MIIVGPANQNEMRFEPSLLANDRDHPAAMDHLAI
jgi:hypothetical protein